MATSTYLSNCKVMIGATTATVDISDQCQGAVVTIGYDQLSSDSYGNSSSSNQ